jgi:hypothetical protein
LLYQSAEHGDPLSPMCSIYNVVYIMHNGIIPPSCGIYTQMERSKEKKSWRRFHIVLDEDDDEILDNLLRKKKLPVTYLIRQAIRDYAEKEGITVSSSPVEQLGA